MASASRFTKVPQAVLGMSTPEAWMFGNKPNPTPEPKEWTHWNWLQSRFHFSFAEYSNPKNIDFGVMRVLNDDLVQPDRGFGAHPHSNMEICTYIVHGELTHKDSMGTAETLSRGAVQYMTAGKGVRHSEHNNNKLLPLRFLQIWISPRMRGLDPNYGSFQGDSATRLNQWQHLVTDVKNKEDSAARIRINQDVNMYVAEIDIGKSLEFPLAQSRQAYIVCVEGKVSCSSAVSKDTLLEQHDAAEAVGPQDIVFTAMKDTSVSGDGEKEEKRGHVFVIEMAEFAGSGRKDL